MHSRMYVSSPFIDDILIMTASRTQRMGEYPVDVTPTYKGRADGSTMKALVWMGTKQVELMDAPVPDVTEPDDVIVKVTGTTICGSDLHLYHGSLQGITPTATEPHPVTNETLPIGMGHECVIGLFPINTRGCVT